MRSSTDVSHSLQWGKAAFLVRESKFVSDSSLILSFHQGFLRSFLTIFMQILGVEETPWAAPYFKKSEVNIFDEQEKGLVLLRPAHSASPHVLLFSVERNTTYTVSIHL